MDCLFCRIVSGDIKSYVVYQDDSVVALLDAHPVVLGHTLVIPKSHAKTLLEVSDEVVPHLWSGVQKVIKLLSDRLKTESFTIGINHGKVSGQVVEHVHIHILPRYQDDGGSSVQSVVHKPSQLTLDEVYDRIKLHQL